MLVARILAGKFHFIVAHPCRVVFRMSSVAPSRNYEDAIERLMSLQTITSAVERAEKEAKTGQFPVRNSNVTVTNTYLNRLGITSEDMSKLKVIHVAGTKGKGSTCALTESILRHCGYTTGFISSPHLMEVRERIRLNGRVIPRDLFSHYFFEIWEIFKEHEISDEVNSPPRFPSFLKYLVVMSYYVFVKESVDVAVVEVGLGGRFDCTNVIQDPVVTAITHLGYDHCSILGNTIEEIAWEKAGIIKRGVPVLTVRQHYATSYPVLEREAKLNGTTLEQVPPLSHYTNPPVLSCPSKTWDNNISLALQISKKWLSSEADVGTSPSRNTVNTESRMAAPFKIPAPFLRGISSCQWPGRNHVIYRGGVTYYLDGAHTPVSIKMCSKWFRDSSSASGRKKVLIVNTTKDRPVDDFLDIIREEIEMSQVVFCPNIASNTHIVKDCEWPENIKRAMVKRAHQNRILWNEAHPDIPAFSFSSVEEGIGHIEALSHEVDVLVTGSLHLIGAAIHVLNPGFLEDTTTLITSLDTNTFC